MPRGDQVHRPVKKSEFTIEFGNRDAERGWNSLLATRLNAVVEAWDFLTATPHLRTDLAAPLRGSLGIVVRGGDEFEQWQLKLNHRDGVRIWYFVDGATVVLVQVHTAHPNETK